MNLKMWFDGSCIPVNPGKETIGAVIVKNEKNEIVYKKSKYEEHNEITSSNYAEYVGLSLGIDYLVSLKEFNQIQIFGDSQLVICQMNGVYRIKEGKMYSAIACTVLDKIKKNNLSGKIVFTWIPREQNLEADELTR